jgi:hypothetical protein
MSQYLPCVIADPCVLSTPNNALCRRDKYVTHLTELLVSGHMLYNIVTFPGFRD